MTTLGDGPLSSFAGKDGGVMLLNRALVALSTMAAPSPPEAASTDLATSPEPAATSLGWTRYTSEEELPVECNAGSAIDGVQCSGSYCDNVRAHCMLTGLYWRDAEWTGFFSEEGARSAFCRDGYWVTGLACRGSYCDDIALRCTEFPDASARNCYWTGWISEEGGGELMFGGGYFALGAECDGSYCDNKRFYVCQM